MKQLFETCGLPVARGELIADISRSLDLADTLGYPLILKPDEGVGAGGIYRVADKHQLKSYLSNITENYLIEEFIEGDIVTYDGLTDYDGNVVFENSLIYGDGVLEYVLGVGDEPYGNLSQDLRAALTEYYQVLLFVARYSRRAGKDRSRMPQGF